MIYGSGSIFFKIADKLGYIDDYEVTARLMVRYGIGEEVALPIYKAWKKSYMETLREKERSKAYGNYN